MDDCPVQNLYIYTTVIKKKIVVPKSVNSNFKPFYKSESVHFIA